MAIYFILWIIIQYLFVYQFVLVLANGLSVRLYVVTVETAGHIPHWTLGDKAQGGKALVGVVGLSSLVSWMPVLLSAKAPACLSTLLSLCLP